jgi:hypothetical protein
MNMNKEKWINEMMSSLDGAKPAEANPFLYNRILGKLAKSDTAFTPVRVVWLAAASFLLLLTLNFMIVKQKKPLEKENAGLEQIAAGLLNTSNINYN